MKQIIFLLSLSIFVIFSVSCQNNPTGSFLQTNTVTLTHTNFVTNTTSTSSHITETNEVVITNYFTNYFTNYSTNYLTNYFTNIIENNQTNVVTDIVEVFITNYFTNTYEYYNTNIVTNTYTAFETNVYTNYATNYYLETNYIYVYNTNTTEISITNMIDQTNIVYSLSSNIAIRFGTVSSGTTNYETTRTRPKAGTVTRIVEISNKSSESITIYYLDIVDLKSDYSLWGVYRITSTNTNNNFLPKQVAYYSTQNEVTGVAGYQYYTFVGAHYIVESSPETPHHQATELYKTVLR